jgi:phage shock protein A
VTPAHELLLAHLRNAHARCAAYKERVDSLTNTLKRTRESRDEWKRRAILYREQKDALRNRLRDARASRDLWRHRAMTRQEGEVHELHGTGRSKAA